MIGLVAYGAGNLCSVSNALDSLGVESRTINQAPSQDVQITHLILPGVGHFGHLMEGLEANGLGDWVREWIQSERPFLGICLGMQALFSGSEEAPHASGLGWFDAKVVRYCNDVKVPHMGWDTVTPCGPSRLFEQAEMYYFANSYYAPVVRSTVATCHYGGKFTAVVERGNLAGVQFHPEKSGPAGIELLRRFCLW